MRLHKSLPAVGVAAAGVALVGAMTATSSAAEIAPRLNRVNLPANATAGCCEAFDSVLSADGRFVAFATNTPLVAGDRNGTGDVYVGNLDSGAFTRASGPSAGAEADRGSSRPSISDDGRFVAFVSSATNLVAGDTNGTSDVFVRDLVAGTTVRASVSSAGAQSDADIQLTPRISGDGRFVTFATESPKLVEGDAGRTDDVFVRDLAEGTTTRVSIAEDGTPAPMEYGGSLDSALAPVVGSRFVAFESFRPTAGSSVVVDVRLRDLVAGTTTLVSTHRRTPEGTLNSSYPSMSQDGRYVVFMSLAPDLVDGDTNGREDIFLRDLRAGTTTRINTGVGGAQADRNSSRPSISADGRFVTFVSAATNLVAGDTNGFADVFVRDLAAGSTTRVSTSDAGEQADWSSENPSVSAFGTRVSFESRASNLVFGDALSSRDVFVRDLAG